QEAKQGGRARRTPLLPIVQVEEAIERALPRYASFALRHLKQRQPIRVGIGLQNISGYRIAVDEQLTEVGAIAIENGVYSDTIVLYDRLDTVDWRDVLLPFFQRIWLTFDRERPAKFRS